MEAASKLELPHVRSSFSPKNQSDDAQARFQYELLRLRDPATGTIPLGIRERELAFARRLPRAEDLAAKSGRLTAQAWTLRGPMNVGGRTRGLAVDLDYNGTTNRRILAGGISGGIYLSENDGESWTLLSSLSEMASVTCLAQDPTNRNIWYFGTGEFLGNSAGGGLQQYFGQGIFKSTDNGNTWAPVLSTRQGDPNAFDDLWDYVWNVAVHPSGTVFAATFGGLFRSPDGGVTWEYLLGRQTQNDPFSSITDVAIAADGDVYATLSRNGSGTNNYGVFKSSNGGDQWQDVTPPELTNDPYRMVLGASPSDANTVYLLVQTTQQGATAADHQLFRYNDGSGTWTNLSAAIPDEAGVDGNASFSSQGGYDQMVTVKPDDPNVVFIGGTNLYRSDDGGNSFTRIGGYSTPANYAQFDNHHSDQHVLVFLPTNPNVAISGHDGGLSRADNIMATPMNWTSLNNGYITSQFYAVAMDPTPGGLSVIGGLQDNGTWGTQSADAFVEWFDLFGGDGAHAAIAPGATALYVSSQNGNVFRRTNSGYAAITPQGAQQFMFINPFILDPNDSRVMYMGEAGGVWRNSNLDEIADGGQQPTPINWTFLNASAQSGNLTTTIAASTTPSDRIYFGTTNYQSQSTVVRVDNASADSPGTVITPPVETGNIPPFPSTIAVNPENGDEVMVVFSNYNIESIWHSTNAGGSWTNVDGNLGGQNGPSIRSATIVPTDAGAMYFVGTSTGIYSTTALSGGTTTWAHEGSDVLGNLVVDMVISRPADGTLVAGSHGRGVYQATISAGGSAAVASLNVNQLEIEVQPGNSASTTFTLTNNGTAPLSYSIGALGKSSTIVSHHRLSPHASLRRPSDAPRTFSGSRVGPTPEKAGTPGMSHTGSPGSVGDFIVLDDGDEFPDDFLGWGDGITPFQWGSRFTTPVGGFQLERFYVFMRTESESVFPVSVFITDPNGNVFVSGTVSLPLSSDGTWYEIFFDPIDLPEGQLFDIELVTPGGIFYPAGVDANAMVPQSGFYWVNSGFDGWYAELSTVEGFENGAWLIRAEGTAQGSSLNQPPTATIVASKTQAIVDESITFDATSSKDPDGSIVQYTWTFGDGNSSSQSVVEHAFTSTGTYTVTLTVTDNEGATASATRQITISSDNQAPTAVIQTSKIQAQIGEEITFDGSNSTDDGTIVSFVWSFGDGASSDQAIANHAYSQAGSYNVTLRVTDDEGATGQASVPITIAAESPRLTASPPSGQLAPGASQVITVTYDAANQDPGQYEGEVILNTNGGNFSIPVSILVDQSVDVEPGAEAPRRFTLDQNFPNPFNPQTTIQYSIERPGNVRLTVFDLGGRVVRILADGMQAGGSHEVTWDGRDEAGRSVASGAYFYRLEAFPLDGGDGTHFTRKMLLVK